MQQVVFATAAVGRVVAAVVGGESVRVSAEVTTARMAVCLSRIGDCCGAVEKPARTYHRCLRCSCWLDGRYLHKAELATEKCPRSLWPE